MEGFRPLGNNYRVLVDNQQGFSLIEVLVSLMIFSIGILAVAEMQVISLRGNSSARGMTEATTLVKSKIEELKMLEFNDGSINDYLTDRTADAEAGLSDGQSPADDIVSADWPEVAADRRVSAGGYVYDLVWNVHEKKPGVYHVVRVIARWGNTGSYKFVWLDTVIPLKRG